MDSNLVKGIFISHMDGRFLVSVNYDDKLDLKLFSAFIGALQMFGKEAVGNISDIQINGWDIEVLIVNKHNLILTALFSPEMHKKDIKKEAEMALDAFYQIYGEKCYDSNCLDDFKEFENNLKVQINEYFEKVENSQKTSFLSSILKKISKK